MKTSLEDVMLARSLGNWTLDLIDDVLALTSAHGTDYQLDDASMTFDLKTRGEWIISVKPKGENT